MYPSFNKLPLHSLTCCPKFLANVLCNPWHLEFQDKLHLHSSPANIHAAVNHEIQGSKHAVDISIFVTNFFADDHMWERQKHNCLGHAPYLHNGQVHVVVQYTHGTNRQSSILVLNSKIMIQNSSSIQCTLTGHTL